MTFHVDWTTPHADAWAQHLAKFKGQPNLRALEIGVLEGRSTAWFLDNVLTDESSRITCVDPFLQTHHDGFVMKRDGSQTNEARARFIENVERFGPKVLLQQRYSIDWFAAQPKPLPEAVFDFAYIDGSHTLFDASADLFFTWRMTKPGGVIIVDDYAYTDVIDLGNGDVIEPGVTAATNAWLAATKCKVLHSGKQLIAEKV